MFSVLISFECRGRCARQCIIIRYCPAISIQHFFFSVAARLTHSRSKHPSQCQSGLGCCTLLRRIRESNPLSTNDNGDAVWHIRIVCDYEESKNCDKKNGLTFQGITSENVEYLFF